MSIHDILLPPCLEVFVVGRSTFATSKVVCASGREIRSLDQESIRGQYLLKDCFLSKSEFIVFSNFFRARRGSRFAFLLKDFAEFSVQKQRIGLGNGAIKDFQLCRSYDDEKFPYIRKITKIKRDSLKIYIGETQIQNWHINEQMGVITLENPLEQDRILYASFEFYVVVRFSEDSFDYQPRSDGTIEILNVSLIEVLE